MTEKNKKTTLIKKAVIRQTVAKTVFPPEATTSNGPPGTTFSVKVTAIHTLKEGGK